MSKSRIRYVYIEVLRNQLENEGGLATWRGHCPFCDFSTVVSHFDRLEVYRDMRQRFQNHIENGHDRDMTNIEMTSDESRLVDSDDYDITEKTFEERMKENTGDLEVNIVEH